MTGCGGSVWPFLNVGPSCITSRLGELGVRVFREYSRADWNVLMGSDVAETPESTPPALRIQ